MSKVRKVQSNQNSNEFINLILASKELGIDVPELIRLGAFENLAVFVYACYEEPFYPMREPTQDAKTKLHLDGYFQLQQQDLKKMLASHKAQAKINVLISESGEKFIAEWFEYVTIDKFSMLYLKKSDTDKLNGNLATHIEIDQNNNSELGRRDIQLEIIQAVIDALEYSPMKIPNGGKAEIKKICIKRSRLFTDSSFDHAWKVGVRTDIFRLENHENFSSRR